MILPYRLRSISLRLTNCSFKVGNLCTFRKCSTALETPEENKPASSGQWRAQTKGNSHKYNRLRKFVDWTYSKICAGNGGDGSDLLRKTRQGNTGGPEGGDGGRGADIILIVDDNLKELRHIRPHYKGENGAKGHGNSSTGKNGTDTIIKVPVGTIVRERHSQEVLLNLETTGRRVVLAKGGIGGLGNLHFATAENQAPTEKTAGQPGEEKHVEFELKLIADVGLVGYPNAGKSTLLRALSRATPAVAAYPFTTLRPYIGVTEYKDLTQIFVADIPGLIDGAHLNRGLGHAFLRHVERCKCLLYVIDLSCESPLQQLNALKRELNLYKDGLAETPSAIIGNKLDLVHDKKEAVRKLSLQSNTVVIPTSGKYKLNIDAVKDIIYSLCVPHIDSKKSMTLYRRS